MNTMRCSPILSLLISIAALLSWTALPAKITISPGGTTIQSAVNSASDGETVVLKPGVYNQHGITLPAGKSLTLQGEGCGGAVVIDGGGSSNDQSRIMTYTQSASLTDADNQVNLTIRNITFRNSIKRQTSFGNTDNSRGGAVKIRNDNGNTVTLTARIENCVFHDNEVEKTASGESKTSMGGALFYNGNHDGSEPMLTIKNCVFYNNRSFGQDNGARGGAIHIRNGPADICYSTFYNNTARGGPNLDNGDLDPAQDRLAGGAIALADAFGPSGESWDFNIRNCIFSDNEVSVNSSAPGASSGDWYGGAVAGIEIGNESPENFDNSRNIVHNNSAKVGNHYYNNNNGIYNTANPDFVNAGSGNFELESFSPAVDDASSAFCSIATSDGNPDIGGEQRADPATPGTQTATWTGAVSDNWHDACNWTPVGVPQADNPVVIPNQSNNPRIYQREAHCETIEIKTSNGAELEIDNSASAGDDLQIHQ